MSIKKYIPRVIKQKVSRVLPLPFMYGKAFRDMYNLLQGSQWWTEERLEEFQMRQLKKLLKHSYENVNYYKNIFDERGLRQEDIQCIDDLKKLPYLTREDVRDNPNQLVAASFPKSKLIHIKTGGSTGVPLSFYAEKGYFNAIERAFICRQWNWIGYNFRDKLVELRGKAISQNRLERGVYWDFDRSENRIVLSSFHMRDENLSQYLDVIRKFRPKYLHVYPSSIDIISRFIAKKNIDLPPIKAILSSSETLYPSQRKIIEHIFKSRFFSHYGQGEHVVLACECEENDKYHIIPEYGITRLVRPNGEDVDKEGEVGEITGTGFYNYVMPFINYKTMDLGVFTNKKCNCGRNFRLLERIEGRLQDLIITKDDRMLTLTAFIFGRHYDTFSKIKSMQLVQERKGEILVRLVKDTDYTEADEKKFWQEMLENVDNQLNIRFEYVDDIAKTDRGKHKFLIQKVDTARMAYDKNYNTIGCP